MGKRKVNQEPTVFESARADALINEAIRQTFKHAARKYGPRAFVWGLGIGLGIGLLTTTAAVVWF